MIEQDTAATNNFVPFKTIVNATNDLTFPAIKELLGNLILLLPLGFYAPLIFSKIKNVNSVFV